jgi:hypothetical protein
LQANLVPQNKDFPMTRHDRKYTAAATLLFVSAALHVPIAALAFVTFGMQMVVAVVIWCGLGLGLLKSWRWCAYLALLGMFFGVSAALAGAMDTAGVASTLFWIISIVDAVAGAILLSLLWAPRPSVPM